MARERRGLLVARGAQGTYRDVLEKVWSWKGGGADTDSLGRRSLQRAGVVLLLTAPSEAGHSGSPANVCSCPTEAGMLVQSMRGGDARTIWSRIQADPRVRERGGGI